VARRGAKWLKLRFFVYGKMLTGRSRATRLKRRPLGLFFFLLEKLFRERSKLFRGLFEMPNSNTY
jgi:hypothetical protein